MGDNSLEFLTENYSAKFSLVFYDFNRKRELSSLVFYSQVEDITQALKESSATHSVIACLLKPSLVLPAVVLGILKASSYFAFLDINKALASLNNFQKYLPVKTLLVEKPLFEGIEKLLCPCWKCKQELVFENSLSIVLLQSQNCSNTACQNSKLQSNPNPQLCYVIQTSGTTGEAKVVQVPKQCIFPNIYDLRSRYGMTERDVILLCSPLTFDPSIVDIFLALASGCKLVVVPDQVKAIPLLLKQVILDSKVTVLQCTPSLLQSLGSEFIEQHLLSSSSPLRVLALGGEPCLSAAKLSHWKAPDNKTRIFNLYGLTEISCWASCFEVDLDKLTSQIIPLGVPLQDTVIEIKNKEVYIGGPKRWCVLNDEPWPVDSTCIMRSTGDIVYQDQNANIYFQSRKDFVIKHKGKKLSLEKINSLLEELSQISNHYIHFDYTECKLFVFFVLSEDLHLKGEDLRRQIIKILDQVQNLPKTDLIPVSHIPLTKHGKADYRKLLQIANKKLDRKNCNPLSEVDIEKVLCQLWKIYASELPISDTDNFILSGGDSVSAIQFMSEVEWELQMQIPEFVENLLNRSYKEVLQYIVSQVNTKKEKTEAFNTFKPIKVNSTDSTPSLEPKPSLQISSSMPDSLKLKNNTVPEENLPSSKRFCPNDFKQSNLSSFQCYEFSSRRQHCFYCNHPTENCFSQRKNNSDCGGKKQISLQLFCKFDLKKCVDASPTAAYFDQSGLTLVFIGSHSGLFVCYDIFKQDFKWTATLPDRIESSACLSRCGCFVLMGCYDNHLYCFDSMTGTISWKFKTNAEVKCSPVVSHQNVVYVGSHDKHLYAIEVQGGSILWKKRIGEGSVFSSPALHEPDLTVVVATLDGVLSALHMVTGATLWSYHHRKPIFSSPWFFNSGLFIGSTDNKILKLNSSGSLIGEFNTMGPVFSSVCQSEHHFIIGCHDSKTYCINPKGELLWEHQCDSAVYSTPFVFQCSDDHYVAVACTVGSLYILYRDTGKVFCTYKFPGEIFSSVIVLRGFLIVGCRDNYVYCFKLFNDS